MTGLRTWRRLILGVIAVVALVLGTAVRWSFEDRGWGRSFQPYPDSLEYAAGAQALASLDGYFLQVGPHRLPPRYPPGWSLLLSAAVRAGVPGEELWRVTGVLGGLLAALLAVSSCAAAWWIHDLRAGDAGRRAGLWSGAGAGLTAGAVWALAPLPVYQGQTLLSDEPCVLISGLGLALLVLACRPVEGDDSSEAPPWRRRGLLVAAGLLLGLTAAVRLVAAALLAPAVVVLVAAGSAAARWRRSVRRVGWLAFGAVIAVVVVAVLCGLPPWQWSGYELWTPQWYLDSGTTFRLSYAFTGCPDYYLPKGVEPFSHLGYAAGVLLGLTGRPHFYSIGRLWPTLGWLSLGMALWTLGRSRSPRGRFAAIVAAALVVFSAAHVALYSCYFCAYPRFYLAPLAVCLVSLVVAGSWLASGAPGWRALAAAVAAAALIAVTATISGRQPAASAKQQPALVRQAFAEWLALGDEGRRGRVMPFDPVRAQALGLLTLEVLATVEEWGPLPLEGHVIRLRINGFLRPDEVAPAPWTGPRSQPPATRSPVSPSRTGTQSP